MIALINISYNERDQGRSGYRWNQEPNWNFMF